MKTTKIVLAKVVYKSDERNYVYDGVTSRIITIHNQILNDKGIAADEESIIAYLLDRGVIREGGFQGAVRRSGDDSEELTDLVLQMTQSCNLNCEYCIYSGNYSIMSEHSGKNMSEETVRQSIDYFEQNSLSAKKIRISFYGGEPLLQFNRIRTAVDYARKRFENRPLQFSISSNGMELNDTVLKWLNNNRDVTVTITLNGYNHDQYRKTSSGHGSLKQIMHNLRSVRTSYPEVWDEQIQFISNIVTEADLLSLERFYNDEIGKLPVFINQIRKDMGNQIIRSMFAQSETAIISGIRRKYIDDTSGILGLWYQPKLDILKERHIYSPNEPAYVGSCYPLQHRMFVNTSGEINICERVSDSLKLGNVFEGADFQAIQQLDDQLIRFVQNNCTECWAQRLCMLCYQTAVGTDGIVRSNLEEWCSNQRKKLEEDFLLLCEIHAKSRED